MIYFTSNAAEEINRLRFKLPACIMQGMIFPFYKFICPGCGNPLEFHERLSGSETKCPSCGKNIKIPAPREANGKNTWGNWSKGVFLGTSIAISLLIILLLASFFLKG